MEEAIKNKYWNNQIFINNLNRTNQILKDHSNIKSLFDFLFTGSAVTSPFSHFFVENGLFDKELYDLNEALAKEANYRINLVGLGKYFQAKADYNGLYLIGVDAYDDFTDLGVKFYYQLCVLNMYQDIANAVDVETTLHIDTYRATKGQLKSDLTPVFCYSWDDENRFIHKGSFSEEPELFKEVVKQIKNSREDRKYIKACARKSGYTGWLTKNKLFNFVLASDIKQVTEGLIRHKAEKVCESSIKDYVHDNQEAKLRELFDKVFHKNIIVHTTFPK